MRRRDRLSAAVLAACLAGLLLPQVAWFARGSAQVPGCTTVEPLHSGLASGGGAVPSPG